MQERPIQAMLVRTRRKRYSYRSVTYTEVLTVGKDLVIQGKVVGWNDVDASILLDLPVSEPQSLGLSKELFLGDLAAPVCVIPMVSGLPCRIDVGSWH